MVFQTKIKKSKRPQQQLNCKRLDGCKIKPWNDLNSLLCTGALPVHKTTHDGTCYTLSRKEMIKTYVVRLPLLVVLPHDPVGDSFCTKYLVKKFHRRSILDSFTYNARLNFFLLNQMNFKDIYLNTSLVYFQFILLEHLYFQCQLFVDCHNVQDFKIFSYHTALKVF